MESLRGSALFRSSPDHSCPVDLHHRHMELTPTLELSLQPLTSKDVTLEFGMALKKTHKLTF